MTPLARELANQLIQPIKKRSKFWRDNISQLRCALDNAHFFEATKAIPIFQQFADRLESMNESEFDRLIARLGFLPAPKTWIEMQRPEIGEKMAYLLEESEDKKSAKVSLFFQSAYTEIGSLSLESGDYILKGGLHMLPLQIGERLTPGWNRYFISYLHSVLPVINSPRVIGRRQHMPHYGLERELVKKFGPGKFPLRAWTEIKLEVSKPPEIDDGEPHEAHLTGRRALHFCRKHIRIRLGKLEYVSAHWRGDPALGIKQSRYAVVP